MILRTDAEIDRSTLAGWLETQAIWYAEMYWSSSLAPSDFQAAMRMFATQHCRSKHGEGLHPSVKEARYQIADDMLRWAIQHVQRQHDDSAEAIFQAAIAALRDSDDRPAVTERALNVARARIPQPPPYLVKDAIERAAREYRFESRFWRSKRMVG